MSRYKSGLYFFDVVGAVVAAVLLLDIVRMKLKLQTAILFGSFVVVVFVVIFVWVLNVYRFGKHDFTMLQVYCGSYYYCCYWYCCWCCCCCCLYKNKSYTCIWSVLYCLCMCYSVATQHPKVSTDKTRLIPGLYKVLLPSCCCNVVATARKMHVYRFVALP